MPSNRPAPARKEDSRRNDAIDVVAAQLQVLQATIDEIEEDLQWALRRHQVRRPRPIVHITSMPLDPLAKDFGKQVNRLKPEDLPPSEQSSTPLPGKRLRQRDFLSDPGDGT